MAERVEDCRRFACRIHQLSSLCGLNCRKGSVRHRFGNFIIINLRSDGFEIQETTIRLAFPVAVRPCVRFAFGMRNPQFLRLPGSAWWSCRKCCCHHSWIRLRKVSNRASSAPDRILPVRACDPVQGHRRFVHLRYSAGMNSSSSCGLVSDCLFLHPPVRIFYQRPLGLAIDCPPPSLGPPWWRLSSLIL